MRNPTTDLPRELRSQAALFTDQGLRDRYETYFRLANDGKGGDITRGGAPLKTFEEWLAS